jgi:hypothetical protein
MNLKRIFAFAFLVVLTASFTGCSDDDGDSTQNSIKMDGESFKVVGPSIIGVSMDGEGHAAVTFSNGTKILLIDFEYSTVATISGTYSYPDNGTDRLIDEWLTSYTVYSNEEFYDTHLASGTITVKHNGSDNYTVTMDLTMEDGTEFKGTYKGKFTTQFQDN